MTSPNIPRSALPAAAFVTLLVLAFATRLPPLIAAYGLAALVLVGVGVGHFARSSLRERAAMALLVLSLTLMLPLAVARESAAVLHYFIVLVSMAAAFVMTRDLHVYLQASRFVLLAAQGAVFAFLLSTGLADFPLERMLPDSSSNGITSYLIVLQANYSTLKFLQLRRSSSLTALLTLAICLVGYGRGSILAAAAIAAVNAVAWLSWSRPLRTASGLVAASLLALSIAIVHGDTVVAFVELNTKIGSGLYDEPRERIISDYLGRVDATRLLTGADFRGTSIDTDFNDNPHNAYIRAHNLFGLPYLLALLALPMILIPGGPDRRAMAYAGAMLGVVLLRAATEPLLFPTLFDFFFFAIGLAACRAGQAARSR